LKALSGIETQLYLRRISLRARRAARAAIASSEHATAKRWLQDSEFRCDLIRLRISLPTLACLDQEMPARSRKTAIFGGSSFSIQKPSLEYVPGEQETKILFVLQKASPSHRFSPDSQSKSLLAHVKAAGVR
jgi:hypothetical protein